MNIKSYPLNEDSYFLFLNLIKKLLPLRIKYFRSAVVNKPTFGVFVIVNQVNLSTIELFTSFTSIYSLRYPYLLYIVSICMRITSLILCVYIEISFKVLVK